MNSRFCFASFVVLFAPAAAFAGDATKSSTGKRPNILFLFADDWGKYASAYAKVDGRPSPNQVVRTPHIDRLARRGTVFLNAHCQAPLCNPSRTSLMLGHIVLSASAVFLSVQPRALDIARNA